MQDRNSLLLEKINKTIDNKDFNSILDFEIYQNSCIIYTKNNLHYNLIKINYLSNIEKEVLSMGYDKVILKVGKSPNLNKTESSQYINKNNCIKINNNTQNLTFEKSIKGSCNIEAFKYLEKIALNPSQRKKNLLLFLFGDFGTGKTHLCQALANYINDQELCFLIGSKVFNDKIMDIINNNNGLKRNKELNSYKNYFKKVEVLIFDDIHHLFLQRKINFKEITEIIKHRINQNKITILVSSSKYYDFEKKPQ